MLHAKSHRIFMYWSTKYERRNQTKPNPFTTRETPQWRHLCVNIEENVLDPDPNCVVEVCAESSLGFRFIFIPLTRFHGVSEKLRNHEWADIIPWAPRRKSTRLGLSEVQVGLCHSAAVGPWAKHCISEPQFPYLQSGLNTYLTGLVTWENECESIS